jgi:hypothetical protein
MKKLLVTLLILTSLYVKSQITISPIFYGQNFWITNYRNTPGNAPGQTLDRWDWMKESGAKLIRVGGQDYNHDANISNEKFPTSYLGYVSIVDDIRENGCEPMITVPFKGDITDLIQLKIQANHAADIVRTLNVVHKRNVKYFIIANEPDIDYLWAHTAARADDMATYIKAFAIAMRNVDPNIKIIGPELNTNNSTVFDELLGLSGTGEYSLAGLIPESYDNESTGKAFNKRWIDYISFHDYAGFTGTPGVYDITTREQYIDKGYSRSDGTKY